MRRAFVILGLVSAFTFSAPVKADITKWKNVGWWTVNLYSADAGCSAFTEFEGGTSFFIGLTGTDPLILEILLYNDKWKSIQSRKEYSVTAKFGDETRWDMSMTGLANSEAKGLSLREAANSDKAGLLVEEFMRELNMTWTYDGNSLGNFSLRDSREAFAEVVECTKSYREAVTDPNDPFSGSTNESSDPFE